MLRRGRVPSAGGGDRSASLSDLHLVAASGRIGRNTAKVLYCALLRKILAIQDDPIIMNVVLAQAGEGLPLAGSVGSLKSNPY